MSLPELFGDRNKWGPKLLAFLRQSHDEDGDLLPGVVDSIRNGLAQQTDLTALGTTVSTHSANTANPHSVTKAQVGLGNADNTADADKPVSTAQATALALKADTTALTAGLATKAAQSDMVSAQASIVTAQADIAVRARKRLIEAEDYGPISSNPANAAANVATLTAAAAAAATQRAVVQVPGGSIPINADVPFPPYAGLLGAGREATIFLATHANARLTFDEPSFSVIGEFLVDGAAMASQGMRVIGATNKLALRNVRVTRSVRSCCLHNVQNSILDNLTTDANVKGLEILDGCGSLVFNGFNSASNEYWLLRSGYEGVEVSGYTEPTAIVFIAPMLEFYSAATVNTVANVVIEGASRMTMISPNFAHGEADPMIQMSLVAPAAESTLTLIDAAFIGSPAASIGASLANNTRLTTVGRTVMTGLATGFSLTGGNVRVDGDPPQFNSVTTEYAYAGGASLYGSRMDYTSIPRYYTASGGAEMVQRIVNAGESDPRLWIYSDGTLAWGSGSGAADTTLYRSGGMLHSDQKISAFGGLRSGNGAWNGGHLTLEPYHLWVDASGRLRIKNGAPVSDADGTIVGTQI